MPIFPATRQVGHANWILLTCPSPLRFNKLAWDTFTEESDFGWNLGSWSEWLPQRSGNKG